MSSEPGAQACDGLGPGKCLSVTGVERCCARCRNPIPGVIAGSVRIQAGDDPIVDGGSNPRIFGE
jgi:hypothetical protein